MSEGKKESKFASNRCAVTVSKQGSIRCYYRFFCPVDACSILTRYKRTSSCSILLPKEAGAMIASALGYTAIVRALDEKSSDLKTRFMNVNGPIDVSQPLILFPCCIK